MNVPVADNLRPNRGPHFHYGDDPLATGLATGCPTCEAVALLEAIDALPDDDPTCPDDPDVYWSGYRYAMRQVKALLHPDAPA
jgi:hypothetical protein